MADKEEKEATPEEENEEKEDKKAKNPAVDDGDGEEGDGEEGEGGEGGSRISKKRIILAVGAVVLLLVISLAAAFFGGMMGGEDEREEGADPKVATPSVSYFEMDELLVNLNTTGKQASFLKMKVTLELPNDETKAMVEAKMPRIKDTFQIYLRELRSSDLQGSAGMQRLREELLLRLNKILHPLKVNDILFSEIIVQ